MLVHKQTKAYYILDGVDMGALQTEEEFLVDTKTEAGQALARKVVQHCPYYDFVLDDAGNLVDVTPTERPAPEPPPPTEMEILNAKLDFLAMMTGYEEVLTV